MQSTEKLAALLAKLSYREGEFRLSSGKMSTFYLDAKQVTYHPEGAPLVGQAVLEIIREFNVDAVGGPTMGADAIVCSTIWASVQSGGAALPGFIVRKESKEYGLAKRVEGVSPAGKRVALVEDVITTGGSVIRAIEAARAVGADVAVVVGLVDREEGGGAAIEALNVPFRSVCTLSQIRAKSKQIS